MNGLRSAEILVAVIVETAAGGTQQMDDDGRSPARFT
jgi:hypothetical protein